MDSNDSVTPAVVIPAQSAAPANNKDAKPTMRVKVYSPFRVYFDEQAYSISGENDTGPFDILPQHHNFMTLVNACELQIPTPRGMQRIRIARGIMHVKANNVVVFLDV